MWKLIVVTNFHCVPECASIAWTESIRNHMKRNKCNVQSAHVTHYSVYVACHGYFLDAMPRVIDCVCESGNCTSRTVERSGLGQHQLQRLNGLALSLIFVNKFFGIALEALVCI